MVQYYNYGQLFACHSSMYFAFSYTLDIFLQPMDYFGIILSF